jgi:hypothetical protein
MWSRKLSPVTTLKQVLNLKQVDLSESFLSEFPYGCIIVGLQNNGHAAFDERLNGIQVNVDPKNVEFSISNGIAHFVMEIIQ